jgi:hypothetical protein
VADSAAVEARGKPAVMLVATEFARAAEFRRKSLGLPDLPLVVIDLPLNEQAAKEQARAAADRIAAALLGREG